MPWCPTQNNMPHLYSFLVGSKALYESILPDHHDAIWSLHKTPAHLHLDTCGISLLPEKFSWSGQGLNWDPLKPMSSNKSTFPTITRYGTITVPIISWVCHCVVSRVGSMHTPAACTRLAIGNSNQYLTLSNHICFNIQ